MQDTIKKRLKGTNQMRQQFQALSDAVMPLYQMHGIAPGDVEALSQAIQNDDSYWERGAEDAGMTVEQSKNQETRLSLQAAYEVCHMEEMRQMAARNAAKTAESNTVHNIRAGAHRPREAGSGTESAVAPAKIDITKLTRAQRREIERRAERGERITLQEGSLSWKM